MNRKLKSIPCSWCKKDYIRWNSTQTVCSPTCALDKLKHKQEKSLQRDIKTAKSIERKDKAKRKESLRSKSYYVKQAQASFNAYIRKRDENNVCISCQKPPKKVQAGHYKTTAARPDIRFHPFNNNVQCFHCNVHKSGAIDLYRPNLIKKIGEKNVLWLETQQPTQNLTADDLIEINKYYKEQIKLI